LTFDRVIISGLPRTKETALLVLAEMTQALEPVVDPQLREMEGGRIPSALSGEALRQAFGTALDRSAAEETRFLGGESVGSLLDRLLPRLDALRADPSWDVILLVLHGAVNRAVLSYLITGERRYLGGFSQAAGCINVLDVGPEKDDVVMRLMNYSPIDVLQAATRQTTLEELHTQYVASRQG
jgi:probable phosphoglycerate mutase